MPATERRASKIPAVTLGFWLIKIAATTLGETGGDAVTMTLHLGYAIGTAIFFAFFLVAAAVQIAAKSYHRFFTGRSSSPRRRWARQWRISPIAP